MNGSIAPWRGRNGAVLSLEKGSKNGSGQRKMELCVSRTMRLRDDNGAFTNGVHAMSEQLRKGNGKWDQRMNSRKKATDSARSTE